MAMQVLFCVMWVYIAPLKVPFGKQIIVPLKLPANHQYFCSWLWYKDDTKTTAQTNQTLCMSALRLPRFFQSGSVSVQDV